MSTIKELQQIRHDVQDDLERLLSITERFKDQMTAQERKAWQQISAREADRKQSEV